MTKFSLKHMDDAIRELIFKDPRYTREAYLFVSEALNFTHDINKKRRHVNGVELLEGIRQLVIQQFGPMALTVLNEWGVVSTEDFGNIVFNMVDAGLMGKTETDSIADFIDVYDFKKVFEDEYKINFP